MICKKCGGEIPDDSVFCTYCGAYQDDAVWNDITLPEDEATDYYYMPGGHMAPIPVAVSKPRKKNGAVLSWIAVVFLIMFIPVSGSSLSGLFLFLAAAIIIPLRPVQDFWQSIKIRGALKWTLAAVLFIAATLVSPSDSSGTDSVSLEPANNSVSAVYVSETMPQNDTPAPTETAEPTPELTDTPTPSTTQDQSLYDFTPVNDLDTIDAALLDATPDEYKNDDLFSVYSDEYADDAVGVFYQVDIHSDDEQRALDVARECAGIALDVVSSFGADFESCSIMIVDGGRPVGLYMTEDGENYTKTIDGKTEEINDLSLGAVTRSAPADQTETIAAESLAAPEPTEAPAPTPKPETTYVINTHTGKFHKPSCSSVGDIKAENRWDYVGTYDDVINMGYVPCKKCNPH